MSAYSNEWKATAHELLSAVEEDRTWPCGAVDLALLLLDACNRIDYLERMLQEGNTNG